MQHLGGSAIVVGVLALAANTHRAAVRSHKRSRVKLILGRAHGRSMRHASYRVGPRHASYRVLIKHASYGPGVKHTLHRVGMKMAARKGGSYVIARRSGDQAR